VTLPERERELRQKVTDAELERKKAEDEAEKCKLELDQAQKKEAFRIGDLQEEIAELQQALAEGKS
jgi:F0F1-type ATP synthase membrane subunit b/b'